jgi:hypothetical protein
MLSLGARLPRLATGAWRIRCPLRVCAAWRPWRAWCIAWRFGIGAVAFSVVVGAVADGALGCVGACCAEGAVWDVDGADWVDGATVVVDGARGVVGVCAPTGAAIARAAANAVPVKRWFMVSTSDGATRAKDRRGVDLRKRLTRDFVHRHGELNNR